ncbi:MAG: hypothetical protein IJ833_05430 [Lachnospiraceae bacterium]|nr:hypothetical protein [Lachnospiraceae bacterium]
MKYNGSKKDGAFAFHVDDLKKCVWIWHNIKDLQSGFLGLEFVSHKSKEYQEHVLILKDYEDNTTEAMDIVLKNLVPRYFAIIEENKGYFLADINKSVAYGIDAIIAQNVFCKRHHLLSPPMEVSP